MEEPQYSGIIRLARAIEAAQRTRLKNPLWLLFVGLCLIVAGWSMLARFHDLWFIIPWLITALLWAAYFERRAEEIRRLFLESAEDSLQLVILTERAVEAGHKSEKLAERARAIAEISILELQKRNLEANEHVEELSRLRQEVTQLSEEWMEITKKHRETLDKLGNSLKKGQRRIGAPPLEERADVEEKREKAREYLQKVEEDGVPKEVAARLIGHDRKTLDRWAERLL